MATTNVARGFTAPCPRCSGDNCTVALSDLTVTCPDCDVSIDLEEMQAMVAGWTRVFAWIAQATEKED